MKDLSSKSAVPPTVFFDTRSASSDIDKATMFNEFFHSVFTPPSSNHLPSSLKVNSSTSAALCDITVNEEDVFSGSKATGPDAKVLLHNALPLYSPLHHLFSLCVAQSCMPKAWSIHNITPIHKSGPFRTTDRSLCSVRPPWFWKD